MTPAQTIQSVTDAFTRGDIQHIVNLVAPGAVWKQTASYPWGGDYTGPEGAARFFAGLQEHMETTGFEVLENVESGDEVFSLGSYSSNSRKTGRGSTVRFCFRWKVVNGGIVSFTSYFEDTTPLIATLN